MSDALVTIRELHKEFRRGSERIDVLHGVNLEVPQGDFLALMGANGSGKSTLVRAMTGLRPLAAGSVHLFGTDLTHFRDWHRIGFVPQRSTAATGVPASVWEVVAAGRLTRRRWLLASIVFAGYFAGIRMTAGGHFLSDTIFAWFATYFCLWLTEWAFRRMGWLPRKALDQGA